jgi:hypothetical protein
VGLEWGSLSLVSITEELLEWKSSGSGSVKPRLTIVGIRCADHVTPSIRKSLVFSFIGSFSKPNTVANTVYVPIHKVYSKIKLPVFP